MRFPAFMKGSKERRTEKKLEREMAMRGWNGGKANMPNMGGRFQRHIPLGMGRHSPRSTITRGRGQATKRAWA